MCLDQGEPSEGWAVGGGCGKGSRIRAHSGLWNHSEGTGAGRCPQEVTCHFLAIGGLWEYGLSVATPANFSRKVTNLHVE